MISEIVTIKTGIYSRWTGGLLSAGVMSAAPRPAVMILYIYNMKRIWKENLQDVFKIYMSDNATSPGIPTSRLIKKDDCLSFGSTLCG